MIIIAATSNTDYTSYPASFSNVIGVVSGDKLQFNSILKQQKGIDFQAVSNHELTVNSDLISTGKANSYVAPYMTALVANILANTGKNLTLSNIITEIISLCDKGKTKSSSIYVPDWIETAWVFNIKRKSKAKFYFKSYSNSYEECKDIIDTVVLNTEKDVVKYKAFEKNIVYLGEEPIESEGYKGFYWDRNKRIEQISNTPKRNSNVNLPVIVCLLDDKMDVFFWLTELTSLVHLYILVIP